MRDLLKDAGSPLQIPVYLADALFLPTEVHQQQFGQAQGIEVRFGNAAPVVFPTSLIEDASLFDAGLHAASRIAIDHAKKGRESSQTLEQYMASRGVGLASHPDGADIIDSLWQFADELAKLIKAKEDSIWAFIVRNSYRPAMLRGRFDHILGNPPWLSYRYIADPEYQARVKRLAVNKYKIAPKSQNLFTQMELATLFMLHALLTFGNDNAKLGFVMPRSVLSADQHAPLRARTYIAPVQVDTYWDLAEVFPVFRVPSCVLFASRAKSWQPGNTRPFPALEWNGKLSDRNLDWAAAAPHLSEKKITARLIHLGKRNAWSGQSGASEAGKRGYYAEQFAQGATIVPRNCYFVSCPDLPVNPRKDGEYWCETDPEQARSAKPPWDKIRMADKVEGRFFFTTAISKHVLPFVVLEPADIVLPIEIDGSAIKLQTPDALRKAGLRDGADWFAAVEKLWKRHRGPKTNMTFLERLDYSRGLSTQAALRAPFRVVYNAAGTDVSAAVVPSGGRFNRFVVDTTLYWAQLSSEQESDYLVAVLNAAAINDAIKPFQSRGLMGERHVHKKVLELPIPLYNAKQTKHLRLAALGAAARSRSAVLAKHPDFPSSLARRRAFIRAGLSAELAEIDALVTELLV